MPNRLTEWLYNPNAKPARELSEHDQRMIRLGWDASRFFTLKAVGEWLEARIVGGTGKYLILKGWDKEVFGRGEMPE